MQSAGRSLSRWSPRLANKAFSTALEAYRSLDYATALTNFKALAEQNYPDAQVLLARMLLPLFYSIAVFRFLAPRNAHIRRQDY